MAAASVLEYKPFCDPKMYLHLFLIYFSLIRKRKLRHFENHLYDKRERCIKGFT